MQAMFGKKAFTLSACEKRNMRKASSAPGCISMSTMCRFQAEMVLSSKMKLVGLQGLILT